MTLRIGVLLSLLPAILWTGCRREQKSAVREIVYNCPANAAEIEALTREIPHFAEETGISVVLNPFTGQDKLYAMMAAGQAPDIWCRRRI